MIRKNLILILVLCFQCFGIACKQQNPVDLQLKKMLNKFDVSKTLSQKPIIIIPFQGCGSCVSKAVLFMKKEYQSQKYLFVLSSIYQKDFQLKVGNRISAPNVIYDTINFTNTSGLVFNIPTVYFKKDSLCAVELSTEDDYKIFLKAIQ